MNDVPLRQRLKQEFEVDLPIAGGTGKKSSPIVITARTLENSVDTQMHLLRCIGKGRRVAWRVVSQAAADIAPKAVRVVIETVGLTETEAITQQEGWYFILDALPAGYSHAVPAPSGFQDANSGLRLPYELGWLHYDGYTDYESQAPGMGCSAAYGSLGVKATVYVYRGDCPPNANGVELESLRNEFEQIIAEIARMNAGAKLELRDVVADSAGRARFLYAQYELPDTSVSAALLTARDGMYVKVRMTWEGADAKIHQIAGESMRAVMRAVVSGSSVMNQS